MQDVGRDLDHTSRALLATVKASLGAVRADVAALDGPGGEAALRRLTNECDVLSAAVRRLDRILDRLPAEAPAVPSVAVRRVDIRSVGDLLARVAELAAHGACRQCGGVLSG